MLFTYRQNVNFGHVVWGNNTCDFYLEVSGGVWGLGSDEYVRKVFSFIHNNMCNMSRVHWLYKKKRQHVLRSHFLTANKLWCCVLVWMWSGWFGVDICLQSSITAKWAKCAAQATRSVPNMLQLRADKQIGPTSKGASLLVPQRERCSRLPSFSIGLLLVWFSLHFNFFLMFKRVGVVCSGGLGYWLLSYK